MLRCAWAASISGKDWPMTGSILPADTWLRRGGEVPGQASLVGDHPDGMGYLQDNPPTLYVIGRSGQGQHQTQEAANERR